MRQSEYNTPLITPSHRVNEIKKTDCLTSQCINHNCESPDTTESLLQMVDQYVLTSQKATATNVQQGEQFNSIHCTSLMDATLSTKIDSASRMSEIAFKDQLVLVPLSVLKSMFRGKQHHERCFNLPAKTIQTTTNSFQQPKCEKLDASKKSNKEFVKVDQQKTSLEMMQRRRLDTEVKSSVNANKKDLGISKGCVAKKTKMSTRLKKQDDGEAGFVNDANLSQKCKICGDKESKHTHYGGRSCQSCRAFFRRYATRFSRLLQKFFSHIY